MQPAVKRNYANDIQALHGEGSGRVETDIQGEVGSSLDGPQSLIRHRQALQLLEFLIKNGSERVIDDARSHMSLLKMLRQFHFMDQNGKDQGINVRNRSKELVELLSDVERIRAERKKARSTRNKYGGVEGGGGLGMSSGGGNRYGGFGSETGGYGGGAGSGYGGYGGEVYGDGGGFGGNESGFQDTQARRDKFEEYDEYDEGAVAAPGRRQSDTRQTSSVRREAKKAEPPKPKAPEVDLFSFDDPEPATTSTSNGKAPASSAANDFGTLQSPGGDDDDFDDFQSATPSTQTVPAQPASSFNIPPPVSTSTTTSSTQFAAPQPMAGAQASNINNLFASISPPPQSSTTTTPMTASQTFSPPVMGSSAASTPMAAQPMKPTGYQPSGPNYFQSVPMGASSTGAGTPGSNVMSPAASIGSGVGTKPKASGAGGDAFASLLGGSKKSTPKPGSGVSMSDMAKQKTSASLWGTPAGGAAAGGAGAGTAPTQQKPAGAGSSGMDDLLF